MVLAIVLFKRIYHVLVDIFCFLEMNDTQNLKVIYNIQGHQKNVLIDYDTMTQAFVEKSTAGS